MALHDDLICRAGQGLGCLNNLIDLNGNGTDWASATTAATFNAITAAKIAGTTFHEADKAQLTISQRVVTQLNQMGVFTDTQIAAGNTTALIEAAFTAGDSTLSATQRGTRGMD